MIRYAVASNFEVGATGKVERRFFTGALTQSGEPFASLSLRDHPWALPSREAADCVATHLTELAQLMNAPRTWGVVELHPAIKRRTA